MTIRCFLKVNEHTKLALATTFSAELLCSFFELVQLLPVVASPFILVILQFPVVLQFSRGSGLWDFFLAVAILSIYVINIFVICSDKLENSCIFCLLVWGKLSDKCNC